ncbi:MAG TPA: alpha/beta hydrolase [Ktedonobacter sp.]|nr:alpha/beta hydrolase [Ktedonobacter sp.]
MKIRVYDIDLAYDDHGIGIPVIFLHAFPLNRSMWDGVTTALLEEQCYRLVTLDWRGFGESDITSDISTMDMFADDVVALMDALGMQQAVICGLSMGGYAAFALWRKYASRIQGMILSDTRPGADNEEGKANREQLAQLVESQGVDAVADLQMPRLLSEYTRQNHPEVELRVRQMIDAATPQGISAASRGMAQRPDSTNMLPDITCPTLIVVGEQDAITPPSVAQDYASKIPNAQLKVIPQAGHLSTIEQPEAYLEQVKHFLLLLE